jgi:hypothetical protein
MATDAISRSVNWRYRHEDFVSRPAREVELG